VPAPTTARRPLWLTILQFPLTRLIVLGAVIFAMMMMSNTNLGTYADDPLMAIGNTIGLGVLALILYSAWGRFIERREVTELSTPGMGREWATGALIGAALYVACAGVLILLGLYRIDGLNPWTYLVPAIAMALSSGIFEELFFRGVVFRSVEDLMGTWIALIVSSLLFGFLHLLNPGGTLEGAIYISIEAGLLLAAAYLVTRRLWMSIGFHMAWNYTQSAIFSGVVSGNEASQGPIRSTVQGSALLTGGKFGVESSVLALLVCTTTGVVMLAMAVWRGKIVPPAWKRAA
jgi:uncharacterized protein